MATPPLGRIPIAGRKKRWGSGDPTPPEVPWQMCTHCPGPTQLPGPLLAMREPRTPGTRFLLGPCPPHIEGDLPARKEGGGASGECHQHRAQGHHGRCQFVSLCPLPLSRMGFCPRTAQWGQRSPFLQSKCPCYLRLKRGLLWGEELPRAAQGSMPLWAQGLVPVLLSQLRGLAGSPRLLCDLGTR